MAGPPSHCNAPQAVGIVRRGQHRGQRRGDAVMRIARVALALALAAAPAAAEDPRYGDDSSEFAREGECDDRRFTGGGMAADLGWEHVGRDATDCRRGVEGGLLALWDMEVARGATRCDVLDFGDDSSDYALDASCDDPRFEGPGTDVVLLAEDERRDATDCRRLCEFGVVALRDYRSY